MNYVKRRKELSDKIQECVKTARSAQGLGAPAYDRAMAEMQGAIGLLNDLGSQEIAEAHSELTKKTQELIKATSRLKTATWILFFATLSLFLVTVYDIVYSH